MARCSELQFCKVTRETTQKGPTLNAKFNLLHLYHLKNHLDPGFIQVEIQRGGAALFFPYRGTSALHLNEATWIIDGSNELIVDFLFALVLFLDSTQPRPLKNPKQIFFFWIKQTNDM